MVWAKIFIGLLWVLMGSGCGKFRKAKLHLWERPGLAKKNRGNFVIAYANLILVLLTHVKLPYVFVPFFVPGFLI